MLIFTHHMSSTKFVCGLKTQHYVGLGGVLRAASMSVLPATWQCRKHHVLTMETLNPNIRKMEYAVRGPIVARAAEIEEELKNGIKKPFEVVIRANIGDAHAMGQKPLTFLRQVIALCTYPELLSSPEFPVDAKERAGIILEGCKGGSIGSYSDSIGIKVIRKDIASYISERDGVPASHENIFLSTGASDGIKSVMKLLMTGDAEVKAGVMIPIPQYPLYTATTAEYNAHNIPYYLNESNKWGLDVSELERAINEARSRCKPRILVVINPGNPTGQVLSRENIEDVIRFAQRENLLIIADEVYQQNIYAEGSKFFSFKKVMWELGPEFREQELASFMTTSKGFMGECGMRGGYCEIMNLLPEVKAHLIKSLSAKLCPTVAGQAAMDVAINPPKPGDPSYELFAKEKQQVLGDLDFKAKLASKIFNDIQGISCNEVMGAMYAFPSITMPSRAIAAARDKGMAADNFYCYELLEQTGICVVPGSGFGQKEGTYHFRMTILPSRKLLTDLLGKFASFHNEFVTKYS